MSFDVVAMFVLDGAGLSRVLNLLKHFTMLALDNVRIVWRRSILKFACAVFFICA